MPRLEDVAAALEFISEHVDRGKVFVHCRVRAAEGAFRTPLRFRWRARASLSCPVPSASLAWAAARALCSHSWRGTAPCRRHRASTTCAPAAQRCCTASAGRPSCAASRSEATRVAVPVARAARPNQATAPAILSPRPQASCVGPGAAAGRGSERAARRRSGPACAHLQCRSPPRAALYCLLRVLGHALGILFGVLPLVQQPVWAHRVRVLLIPGGVARRPRRTTPGPRAAHSRTAFGIKTLSHSAASLWRCW